jgi:hypothetical protein
MADYVVPYVNTLQRGDEAEVLAPYLASGTPVYTVQINGIEYARVYQGPHLPVVRDLGISFGGLTTLVQTVVAPGSGDVRPGEEVVAGLRWDRALSARDRVTVAMLRDDGQIIVRDERQIGADGPDERGQPGDQHRLTVPPRTPPGSYCLAVRAQDAQGHVMRPVGADSVPFADEWLTLRELTVSRAP